MVEAYSTPPQPESDPHEYHSRNPSYDLLPEIGYAEEWQDEQQASNNNYHLMRFHESIIL